MASGPSKCSALPMKWTGRRSTMATKKGSQKLLWLGTMTTGPWAGTFSRPVAVNPHSSRNTSVATSLTTR